MLAVLSARSVGARDRWPTDRVGACGDSIIRVCGAHAKSEGRKRRFVRGAVTPDAGALACGLTRLVSRPPDTARKEGPETLVSGLSGGRACRSGCPPRRCGKISR